jgi:hypothetical protein
MFKRLASLCLTVAVLVTAFYSPPASAQQTASPSVKFVWDRIPMRTTVGASAFASIPWGTPQRATAGFYADSSVWRKAATTRTLVDTSAALDISDFALPPTFPSRSSGYMARAMKFNGGAVTAQFGGVDSVVVDSLDHTAWVKVRIQQDSTAFSFTGTSGGDSAFVGAQVSWDDGVNWETVSGTPTRAFIATPTGLSGEDGISVPSLAATETSPGLDRWEFDLECQPNLRQLSGTAFIINRTLCCATGGLIRFIFGLNDASGQFKADVGHWAKP